MIEYITETKPCGERSLTVDITFRAAPEVELPENIYENDPSQVNWVREQLARGNEAAWFIAEVTAELAGFTHTEYLCACSYNSFDEFISEDGYFQDMANEATNALLERLVGLRELCSRMGAL